MLEGAISRSSHLQETYLRWGQITLARGVPSSPFHPLVLPILWAQPFFVLFSLVPPILCLQLPLLSLVCREGSCPHTGQGESAALRFLFLLLSLAPGIELGPLLCEACGRTTEPIPGPGVALRDSFLSPSSCPCTQLPGQKNFYANPPCVPAWPRQTVEDPTLLMCPRTLKVGAHQQWEHMGRTVPGSSTSTPS